MEQITAITIIGAIYSTLNVIIFVKNVKLRKIIESHADTICQTVKQQVSKYEKIQNNVDKSIAQNFADAFSKTFLDYLDQMGYDEFMDFIEQNTLENIEEIKSMLKKRELTSKVLIIDAYLKTKK